MLNYLSNHEMKKYHTKEVKCRSVTTIFCLILYLRNLTNITLSINMFDNFCNQHQVLSNIPSISLIADKNLYKKPLNSKIAELKNIYEIFKSNLLTLSSPRLVRIDNFYKLTTSGQMLKLILPVVTETLCASFSVNNLLETLLLL